MRVEILDLFWFEKAIKQQCGISTEEGIQIFSVLQRQVGSVETHS